MILPKKNVIYKGFPSYCSQPCLITEGIQKGYANRMTYIYIIIHLSYIPFKSGWDLPRTENVSTDARCLRRWCSKRPCLPTRRPSRVQCWGIRRVNTIDPDTNLALRQENSAKHLEAPYDHVYMTCYVMTDMNAWPLTNMTRQAGQTNQFVQSRADQTDLICDLAWLGMAWHRLTHQQSDHVWPLSSI